MVVNDIEIFLNMRIKGQLSVQKIDLQFKS